MVTAKMLKLRLENRTCQYNRDIPVVISIFYIQFINTMHFYTHYVKLVYVALFFCPHNLYVAT